MENIELVIKIPKKLACEGFERPFTEEEKNILIKAIGNGTPLPKGHGKLKDFDKIEWYGCDFEGRDCIKVNGDCGKCDFAECYAKQVRELPTIIEADKAESEGE